MGPNGYAVGKSNAFFPKLRFALLRGKEPRDPHGRCAVFLHCLGLASFAPVAQAALTSGKFSGGVFLVELSEDGCDSFSSAKKTWGKSLARWINALNLNSVTMISCGPAWIAVEGLKQIQPHITSLRVCPYVEIAKTSDWEKWILSAKASFADFTDDQHNPYLL